MIPDEEQEVWCNTYSQRTHASAYPRQVTLCGLYHSDGPGRPGLGWVKTDQSGWTAANVTCRQCQTRRAFKEATA